MIGKKRGKRPRISAWENRHKVGAGFGLVTGLALAAVGLPGPALFAALIIIGRAVPTIGSRKLVSERLTERSRNVSDPERTPEFRKRRRLIRVRAFALLAFREATKMQALHLPIGRLRDFYQYLGFGAAGEASEEDGTWLPANRVSSFASLATAVAVSLATWPIPDLLLGGWLRWVALPFNLVAFFAVSQVRMSVLRRRFTADAFMFATPGADMSVIGGATVEPSDLLDADAVALLRTRWAYGRLAITFLSVTAALWFLGPFLFTPNVIVKGLLAVSTALAACAWRVVKAYRTVVLADWLAEQAERDKWASWWMAAGCKQSPEWIIEQQLPDGDPNHTSVAFRIPPGTSYGDYRTKAAHLATLLGVDQVLVAPMPQFNGTQPIPGTVQSAGFKVIWPNEPLGTRPYLSTDIDPATARLYWRMGLFNAFETLKFKGFADIAYLAHLTVENSPNEVTEISLRLHGGMTHADLVKRSAELALELGIGWMRVSTKDTPPYAGPTESLTTLYVAASDPSLDPSLYRSPRYVDRLVELNMAGMLRGAGLDGLTLARYLPLTSSKAASPIVETRWNLPSGVTVDAVRGRRKAIEEAVDADWVRIARRVEKRDGRPVVSNQVSIVFGPAPTPTTEWNPAHADWASSLDIGAALDQAGLTGLVFDRQHILTEPGTTPLIRETVWWLPEGVDYANVQARAAAIGEKLGAEWVRVGRRYRQREGQLQLAPQVSVAFGDHPATATWRKRDDDEPATAGNVVPDDELFAHSLEWSAVFKDAGLSDKAGATPLLLSREVLVKEGRPPEFNVETLGFATTAAATETAVRSATDRIGAAAGRDFLEVRRGKGGAFALVTARENPLDESKMFSAWEDTIMRGPGDMPNLNWFVAEDATGELVEDSFASGDLPHLTIFAGSGSGKATSVSTVLPLHNGGTTTIGNVQVGDVIVDSQGNPTTVTRVFPVTIPERAYRITFDDGATVDASDTHRWVTNDAAYRKGISATHGYTSRRKKTEPIVAACRASLADIEDRPPFQNSVGGGIYDAEGRLYPFRGIVPVIVPVRNESFVGVPAFTLGAWVARGASKTVSVRTFDSALLEGFANEGVILADQGRGRRRLNGVSQWTNLAVEDLTAVVCADADISRRFVLGASSAAAVDGRIRVEPELASIIVAACTVAGIEGGSDDTGIVTLDATLPQRWVPVAPTQKTPPYDYVGRQLATLPNLAKACGVTLQIVTRIVKVNDIAPVRVDGFFPLYPASSVIKLMMVAAESWLFYSGVHAPRVVDTQHMFETQRTANARNEANHALTVTPSTSANNPWPLETPPYALGAWLGDGFSADGRSCGEDDGIFDRVCVETGQAERVSASSLTPDNPGFRTSDVGLRAPLKADGLLGGKRIPEEVFGASREDRLAVLQGLMDTDGTVGENGVCEFTQSTVNAAVMYDTYRLLWSLGIKVSVPTESDAVCDGKVFRRLRMHFTPQEQVFGLGRKTDRLRTEGFRSGVRDYRYVVDVTPIEPEPMRCIEVDSADHTYCVGESYIPTHNSVALDTMLLQLLYNNTPEQLALTLVEPKIGLESYFPFKHVDKGLWMGDDDPDVVPPELVGEKLAIFQGRLLKILKDTVDEMFRRNKLFKEFAPGASSIPNIWEAWKVGLEHGIPELLVPVRLIIVEETLVAFDPQGESPDKTIKANAKAIIGQIKNIAVAGRSAGLHMILIGQRGTADIFPRVTKVQSRTLGLKVKDGAASRDAIGIGGLEDLPGKGHGMWDDASRGWIRVRCLYPDTETKNEWFSKVPRFAGERHFDNPIFGAVEPGYDGDDDGFSGVDVDSIWDD